jgi:hypothetical protein
MWITQSNPAVADLRFQVAGEYYGFVEYESPIAFEGSTMLCGGVLFDPIVCSMPAALGWTLVVVIPLALVALMACVVAMWGQRLRARR